MIWVFVIFLYYMKQPIERKDDDMVKYFVILLIALVFSGCAGQTIQLIDPTGRAIPTPSYTLISTSDINIQTVSYWATFKAVKDLDGTTLLNPKFIPYTDEYKFSLKKYSNVCLTIEVRNPQQLKYHLIEKLTISNVKIKRKIVGVSNLPYRQYVINLPFHKDDIGKIQYGVDLIIDDYPIMHFGDLNYTLMK